MEWIRGNTLRFVASEEDHDYAHDLYERGGWCFFKESDVPYFQKGTQTASNGIIVHFPLLVLIGSKKNNSSQRECKVLIFIALYFF